VISPADIWTLHNARFVDPFANEVQSRGGPALHGDDRRTCTSLRRFSGRYRPSSQRRSSANGWRMPGTSGGDILCGCASRHRGPRGRRWLMAPWPCRSRKGPGPRLRCPHLLRRETGLRGGRGPNMRLPTNTRQLPTSTPTLPSDFDSCMQVAITSFEEALPRTISRSRNNVGRAEEMGADDEVRPRVEEAISSDT